MGFIKRLFAAQFIRFAVVGVFNTLVGMGVSLLAVNLLDWSTETSTALGYFLGSVVSFFLNRRFTFEYKKRDAMQLVRFAVNIIVCWFVSNRLARPLTEFLLRNRDISETWVKNIVTVTANVIFIFMNFFGQKFFAFRKKDGEDENVRDDKN